MQKMWLEKYFLFFKKDRRILDGVSTMQGNGQENNGSNGNQPRNTDMETERGRRNLRSNIERFTRRLWNEGQYLRRMAGLLPKQPSRKAEDEAIQRRKEEIGKRNIELTRLSKAEGWRIIEAVLQQLEVDSYSNLRHPELAKDIKTVKGINGEPRYVNTWISYDYHEGYHNGKLDLIEDLRDIIMRARVSIHKQKQKEEAEANETPNQPESD